MAIERTVRERHEYARLQIEGLIPIRPPRKPAEYRQRDRLAPDTAPILRCGLPCVVRIQRDGSVKGYLLCRVISWREHPESWWDSDTTIYMVPEAASSPELMEEIGVLRHARYSPERGRSWGWYSDIYSFDAADMPKLSDQEKKNA